jgi:hypothetical protein
MPTNSEANTSREIIILLSDEFAPKMPELALRYQVWALRTMDTEKVARQFWNDHPPLTSEADSGGITLFAGHGEPENDFLSIVEDIELHHGIASSQHPTVSALRIMGAQASEAIRDSLSALGFTRIESIPGGFLARWHRD